MPFRIARMRGSTIFSHIFALTLQTATSPAVEVSISEG